MGLVLYPVWVFFIFVENLSMKRGDVAVFTWVGTVNTVVGWMTTIFVFNDAYSISRQQWYSLPGRLLLSGLWRWNNYLVYST